MISAEVFHFLRDLGQNNNREWFAENRNRYEAALGEIKILAKEWIERFQEFDKDIADNDPAKSIFRIYRDTRFSPDKTPYKNHFGLAIGKGGRTSSAAGYYLHISPEGSFIAGGKWMPESAQLKKIRQEIDYNYPALKAITDEKSFKQYFGNFDMDLVLKKPPKDYSPDHPAIEWLKLKSFTVTHSFSNEEISSPHFLDLLVTSTKAMQPFIQFLNTALEEV